MALAFPPVGALGGWLAVPALAALVALFRGISARRGAVLGLVAGVAFFLVLLAWIRVLGWDAWIALSLVCALFWAGAGALLPVLLSRRWWVVTVPLLWVCMEALRERVPFGGFPWGRLAFAQADTPLVGWAALGGAPLVTLAVALMAATLLAALDLVLDAVAARNPTRNPTRNPAGNPARHPARNPARLVLAALLLAGLPLVGLVVRDAGLGGPDGEVLQIAVVQGNVPRAGLDFNAQRRAVLDNHVNETLALAGRIDAGQVPAPVAVIWPENSSDIDPTRWADAATQIDRAAQAVGVPILVGTMIQNPADLPTAGQARTILNISLVWDPITGPGDFYAKRHPVPFGEYLPLRHLLTGPLAQIVTRLQRVAVDFAPGDRSHVLDVGPVRTGVVICFETAYSGLVGDAVREGGRVLVVQTNNATYGGTGQPQQQLAISRVQSVAAGRTTLVAATSGVSAVIRPDGSLAWRTEEFVPASTVAAVPQRSGLTPAVRLGQLPGLAAGALLLALAALGRRRSPAEEIARHPSEPPSSAEHGTIDR